MIIRGWILLTLISLDIVYRLVVVGWSPERSPAQSLDVFFLIAAIAVAWTVQLFVNYPDLRTLRINRQPGISTAGLLLLPLGVILGTSLAAIVKIVINASAGTTADVGYLSVAAAIAFAVTAVYSLIFLIPSVRRGGIQIGRNGRGNGDNGRGKENSGQGSPNRSRRTGR